MKWARENPEGFKSFKDFNKEKFPSIYDEVVGISEGANLTEDEGIALMLRPEIEALALPPSVAAARDGHCFDILYNPKRLDKKKHAFMAHNEDWTPVYKDFGFVLHENMAFAKPGEVQHITAFSYPASPVGFTFGYNDHGVCTSCNGLQPGEVRIGKLGRYFINRYLLSATSVDDALDRLRRVAPDSAFGFAMSIGSSRGRRMYHAEMSPGGVDIIEIAPGMSYLHSNAYTHEANKGINQTISNSTHHRLDRAAEMDEPVTGELALKILGDETVPVYPIYRYGIPPDELATISTSLIDLDKATITIYGGNPTRQPPVVVMPIPEPPGYDDVTIQEKLFVPLVGVAVVLFIVSIVFIGCCIHKSVKKSGFYLPVDETPINSYR